MNKNRIIMLASLALAIGVLAWKVFFTGGQEIEDEQPLAVTIATTQRIDKPNVLQLTGSVEGLTSTIISSHINGRVSEVLVEDGQLVAKGQTLVKLEAIEQENDVIIAQNTVDQNMAKYENEKSDYHRYETLWRQGACSRQQMDSARTRLLAVQADLAAARATLGTAYKKLSDTQIISPVTGVVANKELNPGQIIEPSSRLMTIEQIDAVHVVIQLEQRFISALKIGDMLEITVDAYPGKAFIGAINVMSPVANSENRMFRIKAKVDNSQQLLKPGMFVQARLKLGEPVNVLAVPQQSVLGQKGQQYIYTLEKDRAKRVRVETGELIGENIEIKTALSERLPVVMDNLDKIKEGDRLLTEEHHEHTRTKH